ncbi:MAG: glycosyltransferase [Gemmatimonadetes bacterium]|nr:glycosyltransferase [Gemmatimonadota bacterium]
MTFVAPGAPVGTVDGVRYLAIPRARSRARRLAFGGLQVLRAALAAGADLYHFHDPELIPVGLVLRALGKRVVYDVHEDVPGQIRSKHWLPPVVRGGIARGTALVQWAGLRVFDGVVAADDDVAAGLGGAGVTVLRNFPLLAEFGRPGEVPYTARPAHVVHVGNLSRIRASRELVEAAGLIPSVLDARLVLLGTFDDDGLGDEVTHLPGWQRTEALGWCDRATVAARLTQARVGVVMFGPHPNHYAVRSNKVFEYMAAGLPVVGPDFPAWRSLIEGVGCGVVADPTRPTAIAEAIAGLLADPARAQAMGERGRAAVLAEFNWESEFRRLVTLYERILGLPAPQPA